MRRASFGAALALSVALGLSAAVPGQAFAHPEVDRAAAEVREGNYEAAGPRLEALLAGEGLDVAELTTVLELRAVLFRATDDEAALDRSLRALVSVAPEHVWPAEYPPELETRTAQLRAHALPLRVSIQRLPSAVGVRLSAEVDNDTSSLVRELRYRVFDGTRGQWTVATPPVEAGAGGEVLAFVEAIGPGGAVVASAGSADAPLRVVGPRGVEPTPTEPASGGDWVPWLIGGVVLAVVAGLAIGLGVGLSDSASVTWLPSEPRELP